MSAAPKSFWRWAALALALRAVAALTRLRWNHPDEWYQTVEYANFLVHGTMIYTGEIALHMRNLLWPAMLTLPLKAADAWNADSVLARAASVQLFTAGLSLLAVWGYYQVVLTMGRARKLPAPWVDFAMWLMVLPWFATGDFVRPSQENLAAIALWFALGLVAREAFVLAGIVAVAAAAFKFPAGLFAAGLWVAFALQAGVRREARPLALFTGGALAGIVAGGIPDWMIYGRPWESLWMHFQYNVLSGLSSLRFGDQSAWVYLHFLESHWLGVLAPIGILLAIGFLPGLARALFRLEPWSFALAAYLAGHLWIGHKEERFMIPAEHLFALAGWSGVAWLAGLRYWRAPRGLAWIMGRAGRFALFLILLPNAALLARQLWGFTWVSDGTYFEIDRHLHDVPGVCAIVSVRRPIATTLPWKFAERAPEPPLAYFPIRQDESAHAQAATRPVIWLERAPSCAPASQALLHLARPEKAWETAGCTMLASGALAVVPEVYWSFVLAHDWARGTWYRCPSAVLASFKHASTRVVLARAVGHLERLPPRGTRGEELEAMVRRNVGTLGAPGLEDGSFAEF